MLFLLHAWRRLPYSQRLLNIFRIERKHCKLLANRRRQRSGQDIFEELDIIEKVFYNPPEIPLSKRTKLVKKMQKELANYWDADKGEDIVKIVSKIYGVNIGRPQEKEKKKNNK